MWKAILLQVQYPISVTGVIIIGAVNADLQERRNLGEILSRSFHELQPG